MTEGRRRFRGERGGHERNSLLAGAGPGGRRVLTSTIRPSQENRDRSEHDGRLRPAGPPTGAGNGFWVGVEGDRPGPGGECEWSGGSHQRSGLGRSIIRPSDHTPRLPINHFNAFPEGNRDGRLIRFGPNRALADVAVTITTAGCHRARHARFQTRTLGPPIAWRIATRCPAVGGFADITGAERPEQGDDGKPLDNLDRDTGRNGQLANDGDEMD